MRPGLGRILTAMITAFVLSAFASAQTDERVAWLQEHATVVRTVDPEDDDFADLAPLAAAIGDARVVQLGEQSHGDGTCFLAKCRLVRFLHQELGFDILAWESGFYTCARMEAGLRSGAPPAEAAALGLFPVWSRSEQCLPVFEYARSTHAGDRPLEMAGFDVQSSGTSGLELGGAVPEFFASPEAPSVDAGLLEDFTALWEAFIERRGLDEEELTLFEDVIAELVEVLDDAPSRDAAFLGRSLQDFAIQSRLRKLLAAQETLQEGSNLRDVQMGRNLVWLANEFHAGRKIIVWAASRHIAHDLAKVDTGTSGFDYAAFHTMGDEVHRLLGGEAYTILFDTYAGQAGIAGGSPFDVEPAPAGSFPALCQQSGAGHLLVDLRGARQAQDHWLNQPLVARPFGYALMEARWGEIADAFFFSSRMEPSTLPSGR